MATIQPELKSASDATIEDAVAHADPMLLRGLLYQATGNESLAGLELGLQQVGNFFSARIVDQDEVAKIRASAVALLKSYRDGGADEAQLGPPERLFRSLGLAVGADLPEAERDMWLEQSALDPWARGLTWPKPPTAEQLAGFKVAVIGTGLSGLNAAVHLKRAGVPFFAIEKNPEVGGTWFENRYPGARVDSPSRGPNTNNFGGFQVVDLLEMEIRFALQCVTGLIVGQKRAIDVRPDAYQRFNEELDREEQQMIYMDPRAHNYYQSDFGRSCVNGPIDFRRMWRWLRDPTGEPPREDDAGVRPYLGEDLLAS